VSPVSFIQTLSRGAPIQIASVEPDVYAPGLDYVEGDAATAARTLDAGGATIIPRRLSAERGLHVGDTLQVDTAGGPVGLRVAAVVSNSFPSPDAAGSPLISRGDGDSLFGNRGFRVLTLQTSAANRASDPPKELRDAVNEMAERYGMSATTPGEVAEQVAQALFRLLALFSALVGIALIIAALGTANTMLMNLSERARELSILWSAGMSRGRMQRMAVAEAAFMGLMGGVLGAVLGAILAWVLIVLWSASDFQPAYNFPVSAALIGILVAIVASIIAAIAPARAASRLDARL
jgi:putative ABC transport system permease protein